MTGPGNFGSASSNVTTNCSSCVQALPVTLASFTAKPQATQVLLNWETAQELNNAGFAVERSRDGKKFQTISELLPGHGNSASARRYEWRDAQPAAGNSYYRLRQTDFDGKTSYSPIVAVNFNAEGVYVQQMATPEAQQLAVTLMPQPGLTQVQVVDAVGRVRYSRTVEAHSEQQTLDVPVSALAAGVYFLNVQSTGQRKVIRFMR